MIDTIVIVVGIAGLLLIVLGCGRARFLWVLAPLMVLAPAAQAQSVRNCGDRTKIVERLTSHYGEVRTGAGLTPNNGMMEIFASAEKGTWTILITMPSGMSCLLAAGQDWQGGPEVLTAPSKGDDL